MNNFRTAGNSINAKHEVKKHIKRFIQVIIGSRPNRETTAWRKSRPKKRITHRRASQMRLEQKALDAKNEKMRVNLLKIMTEDRSKTSNVIPGARCSNTAADSDNFRNLHSREIQLDKEIKKLGVHNHIIKGHLESVQPTMTQDIEDEDFNGKIRSRRVSQTSLHLGLIKQAIESELSARSARSSRPGTANEVELLSGRISVRQQTRHGSIGMSPPQLQFNYNNSPFYSDSPGRRRSIDNSHPYLAGSTLQETIANTGRLEENDESSETTPTTLDFSLSHIHTKTTTDSIRQVPNVADIYNKLKQTIVERKNSLVSLTSARRNSFTLALPSGRRGSCKVVPLSSREDDKNSNRTVNSTLNSPWKDSEYVPSYAD